jgi:hypothetical protein
MNSGIKSVWKEAAVTTFKVISRGFSGWTEENHVNYSYDRRCPVHDLNWPLHEHQSEGLPIGEFARYTSGHVVQSKEHVTTEY